MSKNSFVQYCHDIIISELRAVASDPGREWWEVKIWYCACWRACISSGLASEFQAEMHSEMGRDRIESITLAIVTDCFNGIKFYVRLKQLHELLQRRGASGHIEALFNIMSRIYPHEQEFSMLAEGTNQPAATLAGIWNTRPNLLQILKALGKKHLYDFKSLDHSDLYSQPSLIGAAGRKQSLLTIFMQALLAQRDDVDSFKALRSVIEKDGPLQIVEPTLGSITASVSTDERLSADGVDKFCLDVGGDLSFYQITSAGNAFSDAKRFSTPRRS